MESKLKALKVVELKDILAKAQVTVTGKANKPDLIAKILASPEALKVYEEQYGSSIPENASDKPASASAKPVSATQTSAPSTLIAESVQEPTPAISNSAQPVPSTSIAPAGSQPDSGTSKTDATGTVPSSAEDDELSKRKARAARFGIPLVEHSQPKLSKATQPKKGAKSTALPAEEQSKLEARAKRFGFQNTATAAAEPAQNTGNGNKGSKRSAPATETVDAEELERRKKRAERFGVVNAVNA